MASDLPRSLPKSSISALNSLAVGRYHELYGIARGVVINGADVFLQVDICFGADIHALTSRIPLFPQPCKIRKFLYRDRCCLRFCH